MSFRAFPVLPIDAHRSEGYNPFRGLLAPNTGVPNTMLERINAMLAVIDYQDALLAKIPAAIEILPVGAKLIRFANELDIPVLWTEQYPKGLGPTASVIAQELEGRAPIEKIAFDCFGAPDFARAVEASGRRQLLVIGVEAHVCVLQTVLSTLALGYEAFVVRDAVGSRDPANAAAALERMQADGAQIVTSEMAMFEVLRVAGTPEFKRVLPLIK